MCLGLVRFVRINIFIQQENIKLIKKVILKKTQNITEDIYFKCCSFDLSFH